MRVARTNQRPGASAEGRWAGWGLAGRLAGLLVMAALGGCGHPAQMVAAPPALPRPEVSAGCGEQPAPGGATTLDDPGLRARAERRAGYFRTVQERVAVHWRPHDEHRLDRSRTLYGNEDRYTGLLIEARRNGTLASLSVEVPSGQSLLDAMAVQALAQSAPLPPPQPELLEGGRLRFRFGFCFRPREQR
jgi:TonB family protein